MPLVESLRFPALGDHGAGGVANADSVAVHSEIPEPRRGPWEQGWTECVLLISGVKIFNWVDSCPQNIAVFKQLILLKKKKTESNEIPQK